MRHRLLLLSAAVLAVGSGIFEFTELFDTADALNAGIIHEAVQARLPAAGETSHWWNA
jgi:hypothetical protein